MATRENEMIVAGSQTPPRVTIHAMLPPGSSSEANPHRQPISGSSGYAPSTATTSSAYAPAAGATYGSGYGNDKESYGSSAYVPSSRAMGSDVASSGYGNEKVYGSQVPSSHAGSGASALGGVHDKNAYGLGAAAGAPAGAVAGYSAAGPHPIGYDANRLSGIFLRPGIVFPSGDVPRHHPIAAIFDVGMVLLLFAGYIVITALAEWTTTSPGRKGLYFGSMWLVLVGLIGWLAAFWFGWRYARESVTISTAARGLWIGMLIGAIVSAVEWGIVIETLQLQYDLWHLNGISFTSRQVTKLIILKALVLPIIGQTLILLYLYWRTSRRDNRLWRPYSYLILAICLEVGCWASQQVIVYSAYPAWHQSFAGGLSNSDVARGVFGEALFFLLCASPFFIVAGIIAGASRAIHQLHDKEQVEVAHVADLPSELFPGPVAASILWMMMIFLRGFPEVFRLLVLTNGGQGIGPTKTAITIVYILIGLFGYMLLRHRLRNTLPVIFHLDPMDYFGTRHSRAANVVVHRDAIHQQQTVVPVGAARV